MSVPAQQPRSVPCKLAFLGEAPGAEEVDEGRPFVGPSGRVFNAILRAAGVDREECWVGNVFDDKAPDNNVEAWMRDPLVAEPALARLSAELATVKPTVVVPLGGTALWAMTGQSAIAQWRGATMAATRTLPGVKMVPTFHPAYVMRQWQSYSVAIGDVLKAAREAELGPDIIWPERRILIEPTMKDLTDWHHRILECDLLSLDIETGWGQITCFGFSPSVEEAIVVPFVDMRTSTRSYWGTPALERTAWGYIQDWCEGPAPKLGQNFGAYDAFWLLAKQGIKVRNLLHDTRLLHHALYPELEKSLAFMGNSYGNQGAWKTMRLTKGEKRDD